MDTAWTILAAAVAICALLGLAFLMASARRFGDRRFVAGTSHGTASPAGFLAVAAALLVGVNLRTYERLTAERPVVRASFARASEGQFNATLTHPPGAGPSAWAGGGGRHSHPRL